MVKYIDEKVEEVSTTNFLGLMLDSNCNWKSHVETVCTKLSRFVFVLRRLRQVASVETCLTAYHGNIASILQYGLILWGNSIDTDKAFILQKKCVRAICNAEFTDHCKPLFQELKVLTLPCLYIKQVAVFVKEHPSLFATRKETSARVQRSLHANKLHIPKCKLELYKRNVYIMAVKIYNKLPKDLTDMPINRFKTALHRWLLLSSFYSVNEFLY